MMIIQYKSYSCAHAHWWLQEEVPAITESPALLSLMYEQVGHESVCLRRVYVCVCEICVLSVLLPVPAITESPALLSLMYEQVGHECVCLCVCVSVCVCADIANLQELLQLLHAVAAQYGLIVCVCV